MRRILPNTNVIVGKHHWWHKLRLSTQKFASLLVLMAFGFGFTYVWLTNQTAAHGFAIDEIQAEISDLRIQNEKLELRAADLRALTLVQNASSDLALEPADSFEVLRPIDGSVAVQP